MNLRRESLRALLFRTTLEIMNYKEWKYLYPPRPEFVITSDMLPMYEARGWYHQYKKNGTCTTVTIDPKGNVKFMSRHATAHKAWRCPEWLSLAIAQYFPRKVWTMAVAELLHSKTPTIKDTLYFHDIIVAHSMHLIGSTFEERQAILDGYLPMEGAEAQSHWVLQAGIWRAKNIPTGHADAFLGIRNASIDEGLVLKDPKGKLRWCNKADANNSWQVKCRYPTKNYQF